MSTIAMLRYRTTDLGRVELTGATAQSALDGGVFVFQLRGTLLAKPVGERLTLHSVGGTLDLTHPASTLGTLYTINTFREDSEPREREWHASVATHLSARTLRALEEAREKAAAQDLTLQLRLHLGCAGPQGLDTVQAWVEKSFSQSAWLELLKLVAFEDRHALEIPIAGGRVGDAFAVAAEHFRRALGYLAKLDWVAATSEARKTTEKVRDVLKLQHPQNSEWADKTAREAWTLGERIEHARASIHNIFHVANHPGVADDPGPLEAQLAVHLAGVLLRYYSSRHT